jgi:tetratricopeptide (TPR) repeat protein
MTNENLNQGKPEAEVHYERGVAYIEEGRYDRALAEFTIAIRLKPDYADAYFKRGIAYFIKGVALPCLSLPFGDIILWEAK